MIAVAQLADHHSRHGFLLMRRNVLFSARAQFVQALRLLAQALDAQYQTAAHSEALSAGLRALEESNDFIPRGAQLEADLDISMIVASHRTPVLKDQPEPLPPSIVALQRYYTYAQEKLGGGVSRGPSASMALYGLGRVHAAIARQERQTLAAGEPHAIVFYQAALMADPRNFLAANELGVLLARWGRLAPARDMLAHAVSISPRPEVWHNLAVIHERLGELAAAEEARRQAAESRQRLKMSGADHSTSQAGTVRWLSPGQFAKTAELVPAAPSSTTPSHDRQTRAASGQTSAAEIKLCQALGPAAPCPIAGVDCAAWGCCGDVGWAAAGPIGWQEFAQGEYVGHARTQHVSEYRLRVDDQLEFIYLLTRTETTGPYRLEVGDEIRVEAFADPGLSRDLMVQPDGTITLRLLGQVRAKGQSVADLREALEQQYRQYYREPAITVTPLKVNTRLEDLRSTVDARAGTGGQRAQVRVTPEGTVSLPGIGSVMVQGMTLDEARLEVNERYRSFVQGIEITPVLVSRAPRYVFVVGEVRSPGRFTLEGPTTATQAIALAGGWNVGANVRQVVVFRRGDDWRLLATMLDLRGALYGKNPCPPDEIWLNDSDVVIVPKSPILVADDFIELVFTRGIYGVAPFNISFSWSSLLNTL